MAFRTKYEIGSRVKLRADSGQVTIGTVEQIIVKEGGIFYKVKARGENSNYHFVPEEKIMV